MKKITVILCLIYFCINVIAQGDLRPVFVTETPEGIVEIFFSQDGYRSVVFSSPDLESVYINQEGSAFLSVIGGNYYFFSEADLITTDAISGAVLLGHNGSAQILFYKKDDLARQLCIFDLRTESISKTEIQYSHQMTAYCDNQTCIRIYEHVLPSELQAARPRWVETFKNRWPGSDLLGYSDVRVIQAISTY